MSSTPGQPEAHEPTSLGEFGGAGFRDPYADYDRRREEIIDARDGEDLGKEQTGVPIDLPLRTEAHPRRPVSRKHSGVGPVPGESEGEVPGVGEEWRLTQDQKTAGLAGVAAVRQTLATTRRDGQPGSGDN